MIKIVITNTETNEVLVADTAETVFGGIIKSSERGEDGGINADNTTFSFGCTHPDALFDTAKSVIKMVKYIKQQHNLQRLRTRLRKDVK